MAAEFKTAQPKQFYRAFFGEYDQYPACTVVLFEEKNTRPDGRELGECRPTVLNVGCISTAEGSALVKLGNTTVICGIKAELTVPKTETPKTGFFVPNVELPPLCSSQFRPGPPSEQAQVSSQFLLQAMTSSQCLHLEDLCVVPGKVVWVLHCDVVCLNFDGNIQDASLLACVAALKTTQLPTIDVDEESGALKTNFTKKQKLNIHSEPVSTTFAIFDDELLLVDPTQEEETLSTGGLSVVTAGDKICFLHKPGGSPLSDEQLQTCLDRALHRTDIRKLLQETLLSLDS